MDQQQGQPDQGAGVRRLHIAHRRSPSELTPLMMEQLALQQRIDILNQQTQQLHAAQQHYANTMGMIPGQHLSPQSAYGPIPGQMGHMNQTNQFQFQQQQQLQPGMNQGQQSHRRNQSALPNMGPPPAPSSGSAGFENQQSTQPREGSGQRGGRGGHGAPAGAGHHRRHSLALPEAKKAAELAQQKRTTSAFQFPIPGAGGAGAADSAASGEKPTQTTETQGSGLSVRSGNRGGHGRSQSMMAGNNRQAGRGFQFPAEEGAATSNNFGNRGGHNRSQSRNFDGNWRQPQNGTAQLDTQAQGQPQQQGQQGNANYRQGHRARGSVSGQSVSSMGSFQYPGQPQLMQLNPAAQSLLMQQPQMFGAAGLSQMQINQLLQAQLNGQQFAGLQGGQMAPQLNAQQQQQRKTLFTPYLGQAQLPELISSGHLVTGILRVNKKNRSDAYVTTDDGILDADIFICGSKDRNRALEGDLVAVELLDVDDVWGQKREKEEKKKRKDLNDGRSGSISQPSSERRNDNNTSGTEDNAAEGGIRRRGSLRQRPTQKKNDDVEVEGQSLLLVEEEELSDEQKPLYAGHIVAVIERVAGQMFSGTLGLLRPSSQATKEKQEAERQAREGSHSRQQPDKSQDKPKIVWFKPTDKRVPLIAIPTEQAPRDFVENHQTYSNRIFVACIKRWPITSLHPFGTLVEQLGEMGDLKVETDALLRDNNFGPDEFSENIQKSVGFEDWTFESEAEKLLPTRRDLREETVLTISSGTTNELDNAVHLKSLPDGFVELGFHVSDLTHFVAHNSIVDREAKKRGTAVHLLNRTANLLPPKIAADLCSFNPGQERLAVSVIYKLNATTLEPQDEETWIGTTVVKSSGIVTYADIDAVAENPSASLESLEKIKLLSSIALKFRSARFTGATKIEPLRLLHLLDDENTPVETNIYNSTPAHEIVEELQHKVNATVAKKLVAALPEQAILRRQSSPAPRRLATFVERMSNLGIEIDTSTSGTLQKVLFQTENIDIRQGMETLLIKSMQRAKYFIASKIGESMRYHYGLNLPLYTHFTGPLRGYADLVVQRQLVSTLTEGGIKLEEDVENLTKLVEQCNTKKDSAINAQEQSVHIEACRAIDKDRASIPGDFVVDAIVICVYESAFDVLIPQFGFEKRVHCDQLPLKKAEFDKKKRLLELYWERGVTSSSYVPEDERPRAGQSHRAAHAARQEAAAQKAAQEREEAQRRQMDTGSMATDDVDALFDDDEDVDDVADATAGVSLDTSSRPTQSMPGSPTRGSTNGLAPHRTRSDPRIARSANEGGQKQSLKEKYLSMVTLREENGEYIQDVREMTTIPIILKTDLSKSPPCLTIRSVNPYAL